MGDKQICSFGGDRVNLGMRVLDYCVSLSRMIQVGHFNEEDWWINGSKSPEKVSLLGYYKEKWGLWLEVHDI